MSENELLVSRVQAICHHIGFIPGGEENDGYQWIIREGHGGVFVQGRYWERDVRWPSRARLAQDTRKWLISPHMTDSEIVSTIFKLCITSMEHRTREWFTYKDQRIFGPHFNVEDLVKLAQTKGEAGGREK